MHRDFQSRNIMVKEGRLRIVDFQTAHRGPGLYDLASLLKDPYHPVPREERRELAREFRGLTAPSGAASKADLDEWHDRFTSAGIQRNLQALAAFAKLGLRKGKPVFLSSIPPAVLLLEEGARESGRFPGIERMASSIRERLAREPELLRER
jgi:aminoglycoside/choline kinase family phosphotransferase